MVTRKLIALLLLAAACGKGKAGAPEAQAQAQPVAEIGTVNALPAETRVIIGVQVPRIVVSPLARRLLAELLGRDPEAQQRLVDLLGRCKIDPARDVREVTIAMAEGQDLALIVRGTLDAPALLGCVRTEATAGGGSFSEKPLAGQTIYAATSQAGTQKVWLAFAGSGTVVAALSEGWLAKVLDPSTPRIDSRPDTVSLLRKVGRDAAVWGVGYLPPGAGAQLVKLTERQVVAPALSVGFEASFDKGLDAALRMDMASSSDADHLATFAKGQLDWIAVAAQQYRLGQLVARAQLTTDGPSVKLSIKLDDADVKKVEAALADNPAVKKEQSK